MWISDNQIECEYSQPLAKQPSLLLGLVQSYATHSKFTNNNNNNNNNIPKVQKKTNYSSQ